MFKIFFDHGLTVLSWLRAWIHQIIAETISFDRETGAKIQITQEIVPNREFIGPLIMS